MRLMARPERTAVTSSPAMSGIVRRARALGAHAVDDLQEERDEDDRAEHRHPDGEAHRVRDAEDWRAEELERQDRLGRPVLLPDEGRKQGHADNPEPDDLVRAPLVLGAAPGGE